MLETLTAEEWDQNVSELYYVHCEVVLQLLYQGV